MNNTITLDGLTAQSILWLTGVGPYSLPYTLELIGDYTPADAACMVVEGRDTMGVKVGGELAVGSTGVAGDGKVRVWRLIKSSQTRRQDNDSQRDQR